MARPLRVLIAEDNKMDAALLLRELRRGGYNPNAEMVDTPEGMRAALGRESWDLVLSDYSMPQFSAPAALSLVREQHPDVPFIIISGTVGEETAVESIRAGAQDFMVKGSLSRLLPAIDRELRETAMRAERKAMREQLLISDRMASIGMLAATVAHEINNPLMVVTANLEFIARNLSDLANADQNSAATLRDTEALLLGAQEAAERVCCVARDLKVFSRASEDDRCGPVAIRTVLESAMRMASNEIRHRARLVTEFDDAGSVHANEGRLGQVFLNLIVNAAQAIPEGRAAENEIRVTTRTERERVVVRVSDTGSGIAPENLAKMFTPFFTTKAAGIGTGLGLAICQRIVEAFGGDIAVESEVGRGSVFQVSLPLARNPLVVKAMLVEASAAVARRLRLLVVDDQAAICETVMRMIGAEHEVVTVTAAKDALARIADGERFDVILSDLMMPEMTGADLHAALLEAAPDQAQRMIFMTGGAFSEAAAEFLRSQENPSLEKPFRAAALRQLLSDMSEAHASGGDRASPAAPALQ